MTIDIPVNRDMSWRQLRAACILAALWGLIIVIRAFNDLPVSPDNRLQIVGLISLILIVVSLILILYGAVRKLFFADYALRLTDEGIFIHHELMTRFYPWEDLSRVRIERVVLYFVRPRSVRRLKLILRRQDGGSVKYPLSFADTSLPALTEALEQFIPVMVTDDARDAVNPDQ